MMKFTIKLSTLCMFLFCVFNINAQIIVTATDLSYESVSDALAEIASSPETEAILYLPAGEEGGNDWGANGFQELNLNKSIKIIGAGKDKTIIKRTADVSTYIFDIICNENTVEIHNIGFEGNQTNENTTVSDCSDLILQRAIQLRNDCKNLQISNCSFTEFGNLAISIDDNSEDQSNEPVITDKSSNGVIFNNDFKNNFISAFEDCFSWGYGVSVYGNGSSDDTLELGTGNAIFIEDNYFIGNKHAITSNENSRYVFRYNTVAATKSNKNFGMTDTHGKTNNLVGGLAGSHSYEIYNNDYTASDDIDGLARSAIRLRGGDGVVFGNKISDDYIRAAELVIEGATDKPCDASPTDDRIIDQTTDLYAWDNEISGTRNMHPSIVMISEGVDNSCPAYFIEGTDFFLKERENYTPYPYPHPLVNLALNKPTNGTGYSSSTFSRDKALDGNISLQSHWEGNSSSSWQVDLENNYDINRIKITPHYGGTRYYDYTIQASSDGENWTNDDIIINEIGNTTPEDEEGNTHFVNATNVRHLRVLMKQSGTGNAHLVEFEAYGILSGTPSFEDVNLAFEKPTLAQTDNENYSPSNAVDGKTSDTGIRWQGNDAHFWQVDLGNEYDIKEIKIVPFYNNSGRYYTYEIYGSDTDTSVEENYWSINGWTKIIDQSRNTTAPGTEDGIMHTSSSSIDNTDTSFLNSPDKVQYLRVKMPYNSESKGAHLVEFEVYGTPSVSSKSLSIEEALYSNVLVYPSPIDSNQNFVNIDLSAYNVEGDVEIKVSNALGQTLHTETISNVNDIINLDTNVLSDGLNFLHIKSDNILLTRKIIANKK